MDESKFDYTVYIKTSAEKLWEMLTSRGSIRQYWFGMECESDWKVGSSWKMRFADGSLADSGEILESDPCKRLAIKWRSEWKPEMKQEGYSHCIFTIETLDNAVRLTVTHTITKDKSKFIEAVSEGWPKILSNIKSLLEIGEVVLGGIH